MNPIKDMIIFDLDGTLSDCAHRRYLVEGAERKIAPNWEKFYALCVLDTPITPVCEVFKHLRRVERLAIWSARMDTVRLETEHWLMRHLFGMVRPEQHRWSEFQTPLVMRPAGNTEPDAELKRRWLNELRAAGGSIKMVFDDRKKVVDMWRSEGILCAQVASGEF